MNVIVGGRGELHCCVSGRRAWHQRRAALRPYFQLSLNIVKADLIFAIISPQMYFWAQFFSTCTPTILSIVTRPCQCLGWWGRFISTKCQSQVKALQKEDNSNTWSHPPNYLLARCHTRRILQLINVTFAFKVNYASTLQEGVYFFC